MHGGALDTPSIRHCVLVGNRRMGGHSFRLAESGFLDSNHAIWSNRRVRNSRPRCLVLRRYFRSSLYAPWRWVCSYLSFEYQIGRANSIVHDVQGVGRSIVATHFETHPPTRSYVSLIRLWTELFPRQPLMHNRGQADFHRRKEGLLVVRSNMHDGVTLTYKNFRKSVRCENADGNAMLPVRFMKGHNRIVATHDNGQVGVWDFGLNWLFTVTHPSKVHVIAVSGTIHKFIH